MDRPLLPEAVSTMTQQTRVDSGPAEPLLEQQRTAGATKAAKAAVDQLPSITSPIMSMPPNAQRAIDARRRRAAAGEGGPLAALAFDWRRQFTRGRAKLLVLLLLLIVTGLCENVLYSLNGSKYMYDYRVFLQTMVVLFCAVFFFAVVGYKEWRRRRDERHSPTGARRANRARTYSGPKDHGRWAFSPGPQKGAWGRARRRLGWFLAMALCDTVPVAVPRNTWLI